LEYKTALQIMIVDDFPICNDASLFAKDFREDLLAKFGTR
jgi:hypothetical protein